MGGAEVGEATPDPEAGIRPGQVPTMRCSGSHDTIPARFVSCSVPSVLVLTPNVMDTWHYNNGEHSVGPIDNAELLRRVRVGEISPDDLIWGGDLQEWTPARAVPGLFAPPLAAPTSTSEPRVTVASPASRPAPFLPEAPSEPPDLGESFEEIPRLFSYRGRMSRTGFAVSMVAALLPLLFFWPPDARAVNALVWVGVLVLASFPQVKRMHDIGHTGALVWLNFVPGVNALLQVYLLLRPGTRGLNRYGPDPHDTASTEGLDAVAAQAKTERRKTSASREWVDRVEAYTVKNVASAAEIDGQGFPANEGIVQKHIVRRKKVNASQFQRRVVDAEVLVLTDRHVIHYQFEPLPDRYNAIPVRYDEIDDVALSSDRTMVMLRAKRIGGLSWKLGPEAEGVYNEITARRGQPS